MRTKPKCLDIKKLKGSILTDLGEEDQTIQSISDKLNGSFCSINTNTLSINDPTHEYKEFRNKVKAYMEIFKEHVFDSDHPINIVASFFKNKFSLYIEEKIKELYSFRNSEDIPEFNKICNIKTNEVIKELQKFILKLQTCLRLMYSRTINYQYFIEEKDEVINLITNLIFKDGIIYSKLYELFELTLFDEIKVFENKLNELKGIKPQDLGVDIKFCLNDDTLAMQKKMAIEKMENSNKKRQEENKLINENSIKKITKKIEELNFEINTTNINNDKEDENFNFYENLIKNQYNDIQNINDNQINIEKEFKENYGKEKEYNVINQNTDNTGKTYYDFKDSFEVR
jgi:hypothetical protein